VVEEEGEGDDVDRAIGVGADEEDCEADDGYSGGDDVVG